jgi:hypothetical protein
MKATLENYKREQFEVELHFGTERAGYGQWNINCEVTFMGKSKSFKEHTTDSEFVDELSQLRADNASYEAIQQLQHDKAFDSLSEAILEWCEDVKEESND